MLFSVQKDRSSYGSFSCINQDLLRLKPKGGKGVRIQAEDFGYSGTKHMRGILWRNFHLWHSLFTLKKSVGGSVRSDNDRLKLLCKAFVFICWITLLAAL